MGPTIELLGAGPVGEVGIGDDLGMVEGSLEIEASCAGEGELHLEVVRNGRPIAIAEGTGGAGLTTRFHLEPDDPGWFRVDVRNAGGEVSAFSNPIFHGARPDRPSARYATFVDMTPLGRGPVRTSVDEEALSGAGGRRLVGEGVEER
jgi:hypothetical protein